MDSGQVFGGLFLLIGAAQFWAAYRIQTPRRVDLMLMGAGLVSLGASRIVEPSGPFVRIGSMVITSAIWIVCAYRMRRQSPRLSIVMAVLMLLSVTLAVLDVFFDLEAVLRPFLRFGIWVVAPALVAGGLWSIVTVVRAVRKPFQPIVPRHDE